MQQPRFRVFFGTEENGGLTPDHESGSKPDRITVPLGEILPILTDAVKTQRLWIKDFADDEVTISADLHEVIAAHDRHNRRCA